MTYVENIFLCMASPLLVAALCMGRRQLRLFLFCIAGMGVCLLSAYINTFLAAVCQADALAATVEIAPVVEEVSAAHADDVVVGKVDVDKCPELAQQFGVMSIPTLILFKDGQVVDTLVGYHPKAALEDLIKKAL